MLSRLSAEGVDSSSCPDAWVAIPRPKTIPAVIHTETCDSNILPTGYDLQ